MSRGRLARLIGELAAPWAAAEEDRLLARREHERLRAAGAGPDHGLPFTDRVIVTLVHLRFQLPHAALAELYEVHRSTVTRAVGEIRPLLAARGFAVPGEPGVRLRTLADVFAYAAARGACGNCVLAELLAALLDDGTGRIRPGLVPFAEAFCQMKRPRGGITWTRRPHVRKMLRTLADPGTPVTHETLNGMSPWRSVTYLRDLLMLHGVLPPADRNLMLFERWLDETLAGIRLPRHRQPVERFASWHVRRRLRRFADRGPVTGKQTGQARDEIRLAIAFLAWLHGRGRELADCRQADIDAWYAGGYTAGRLTHAFLRWAMSSKLMARVTVPHQDTANPAPVSRRQRLDLLRRMLTAEESELLTRVAAVLMLLYAQPVTRILALTVDDIACDGGEVTIRLGDPPAPVPEPFASLLLRYAGQRLNLTTATNAGARWLFPGRRGGQPMTPDSIERRLHAAGIPALSGRTAALRHLVLRAPAPVIATMLGYGHQQAARIAAEAGSPWSRYAPEDHNQPPPAKEDS